jgi:hypothetical protein
VSVGGGTPRTIEDRVRLLYVLWFALLGAVGSYVAVLLVLTRTGAPVAAPVAETLRPLFAAFAVVLAVGTFLWRAHVLSSIEARSAGGEALPAGKRLDRLQNGCIVAWAAADAVALLGLVLGILYRDLAESLPFTAAGIVLFFLHRPGAWHLESMTSAGST